MTKQTTPELVSDLRDIQIDSALKMHLLKDQGKINDEEAETWKEVLTVWEQAAERLQEQDEQLTVLNRMLKGISMDELLQKLKDKGNE